MTYEAIFNGWSQLTLADLIVAYRKAKADCFFENGFPSSIKFAEYEGALSDNLNHLLESLKEQNGFKNDDRLLGHCRLIPKKLNLDPIKGKANGHVHFSDPEKAFKHLQEIYSLTPEFRVVSDFPVDAHIISALWINTVGHKFDACLDHRSYGSRLKRLKNDETLDTKAPRKFHISAIDSFEQYFKPYQQWRNSGLKAIRTELEQDRSVIAISLDLKSYYHKIDPTFIAAPVFQEKIGLVGDHKLSDAEVNFTEEMALFLKKWSDSAAKFTKDLQAGKSTSIAGGLAIGLSASRIIGNVLLKKWDDLIQEKLTPIHYGRYVDDMFLVIHDSGKIFNSGQFMNYMEERLGIEHLEKKKGKLKQGDIWNIKLDDPYQAGSKIQFQDGKQKLFLLKGDAGCDLLDSIERDINDLSSEYRLMPSPDQLDKSTAAKVLSASGKIGEEADTLRKADGLTIKRLSWSLQLRHVHTLSRDLPASEWVDARKEFYEFAHHHVLRPDQIFSHYQYLPRLLGIAVYLGDWVDAEKIVSETYKAFDKLDGRSVFEALVNGVKCKLTHKAWDNARGSISRAFFDAAAKNYPTTLINGKSTNKKVNRIAELFIERISKSYVDFFKEVLDEDINVGNFHEKAPLLAKADLAAEPYKDLVFHDTYQSMLDNSSNEEKENEFLAEFSAIDFLSVDDIKDFLQNRNESKSNPNSKKVTIKSESLLPYLFPTRPHSPAEIAELVPKCAGIGSDNSFESLALWAKYVRALRGVWIKPGLLEAKRIETQTSNEQKELPLLTIGNDQNKFVHVGITNLKTDQTNWEANASGSSQLTLERYQQISRLVNQVIRSYPRPQYLLFPELSIPIEWVRSISNRLSSSGINMIAGTQYRYSKKQIYSEACLVLSDNRLGYKSPIRIWQPKLLPAVNEEKELHVIHGKKWKEFHPGYQKPIYSHNGFQFGLMICSELQNSKDRVKFQGEVDALMVLSWNQDLDTFSALIEASALDVHAYTILVNNRKYGDSRVRSPAKKTFDRDLARLRGGENDYCVTVHLDLEKLRAFQSRATRWPTDSDAFKPVPEGFRISKERKVKPPK
jgi:hypothetical protein